MRELADALRRIEAFGMDRSEAASPLVLAVTSDLGTGATLALLLQPTIQVTVMSQISEVLKLVVDPHPATIVLDTHEQDISAPSGAMLLRSRFPRCPLIVLADTKSDTALAPLVSLSVASLLDRAAPIHVIAETIDRLLGYPSDRQTSNKHVRAVFEYLRRNYAVRFRVGVLSGVLGVSSGHLTSLFHAETGMTLRQALFRVRVEVAKHLLDRTDTTRSLIAARAGFADASHMARVFHQITGQRLGEYRSHRRG